jgi:hypothetical protein
MNYLLVLFFILNFNRCFSMAKPTPREEAMNVFHNYSKILEKEGIINRWYGVDCAGPDKIYDGKIHEISLGYSIDKNFKYQEARRFFYRIVDNFLLEINSHEHIRDQFFHYPVTYEDLHFALAFDYKSKGHLHKDDVDMISIQENEIFYRIANIEQATDKWVFHGTYPGMGTVSHTGRDSMRSFIRKLPESEADANSY